MHNISLQNPHLYSHSSLYAAEADSTIDSGLPFEIVPTYLEYPHLGISIRLKMSDQLRDYGMNDIILSATFPECGRRFQVALDLSEWEEGTVMEGHKSDDALERRSGLRRISNVGNELNSLQSLMQTQSSDDQKKRVYTLQVDFTAMRICVGDFGITIPFTLLCFRLPTLIIQRNTVAGNIMADLSIGIASFKWKKQDMELAAFHLGEEGKCFPIRDRQQCLFTKGCGYCDATKQCMRTGSNGVADECSFCPRCSFFTSDENKGECLSKESCGWCSPNQDNKGICENGDSMGPYEASDCVKQTMDTHELVGWTYDKKQDRTLASVFGLLFGLTCGVLLLVLATFGACLLYRKIRYGFVWTMPVSKEDYAEVM